MSFIDIVFAILLGFAIYKGFKNGFFVEVASFIGLLVGIYVALKFSNWIGAVFSGFFPTWHSKYITITAFILTFILVLIGIHLSAKMLTKVFNVAFLGGINKIAGIIFSVLKMILTLSVVLFIVEKININNLLIAKETQKNSIFYHPIQNSAKAIYPTIERWYDGLKSGVESEE
ncbi:CvpA family protein [Flavobacterium sp.]|jgi:membrane protein required for colicin V production|uniref:CvpA family protein n=1 Tax=Flavobacterium sp. TaxID=239 RepID=UPI0037BFC02A